MQIPKESSHIFTRFSILHVETIFAKEQGEKKIVMILNSEHRAMERFEKLMTDKKSSTIDSYLFYKLSRLTILLNLS